MLINSKAAIENRVAPSRGPATMVAKFNHRHRELFAHGKGF
jgi:hypothetical protein